MKASIIREVTLEEFNSIIDHAIFNMERKDPEYHQTLKQIHEIFERYPKVCDALENGICADLTAEEVTQISNVYRMQMRLQDMARMALYVEGQKNALCYVFEQMK